MKSNENCLGFKDRVLWLEDDFVKTAVFSELMLGYRHIIHQ